MVSDYAREIPSGASGRSDIFPIFFSEISLLFPAFCPTFWGYLSLLFPLLFAGQPVEALIIVKSRQLLTAKKIQVYLVPNCNERNL